MDDITNVIKSFKEGKIGIFPTDTAFGIGCRMDNEKSVEKVYSIRQRPEEKALLVLVSSIEMAQRYVELNSFSMGLAQKYWPGGLTMILPCKEDLVPSIVRAGGRTLAVRMPDHQELREIIEKVGVPIVAPSANRSGEATPFTLDEVDYKLKKEVDFILPGVCKMKEVSTIVDTTVEPIQILRQGVVKL